jgi:hypothetical protein
MRKILLYTALLLCAGIAIVFYNYQHNVIIPGTITAATAAPWQPAQLRIENLHIDAPVMNVGETATGLMDAPVSQAINSPYWTSVFWYQPGPAPGQAGNAVIAGHVDRVGGDPAIFWYLDTLHPGDKVEVITHGGQTLQFVVDRIVHYPVNAPGAAVLNSVFGPTPAHHLNLITCSGLWTGTGYDERLVVYTTQVGA